MNRSCEAATGITSEFSEWFELAKAQGLLKLSKRQKKANDSRPHWSMDTLRSFVERGWTLGI